MKQDQTRYLVTANVDFTTQAYEDPDLRKIVFFADRVVCDGMPLVWLSRLFGYPLRERVAGSDMVPKLLEICGSEGHAVYFFGSDLATLEEAKVIVEQRYPGLRVVGMESPPMGAVIDWENEALCERMRASGAKLLLACLGCPKQERWIFAHHRDAGIPLSIGVGASLDFITGKQKRAPKWMQKTGMEWFWRMSSSPGRLVSRYRKDFVFLVKASFQQALSQRRRGNIAAKNHEETPPELAGDLTVTRIFWSGELEKSQITGAPVPDTVISPVFLDASRVSFMDSSGLGRLALLARACRAAQQPLIVVAPSDAFSTSIRAARMDSLFEIVKTGEDAEERLSAQRASGGAQKISDEGGVVWVSFNRSLDALYHDEMMSILQSTIENSPGIRSLVIDLKDVDFMDSRAVGGLIRAWKLMSAKGGQMFLSGARPSVREILRLLRLDKVLPEWEGEVLA
jgi:N-acetylglucosaminyldiphosphoundecaprenol N-acetyl-beta-D-mannosaminyltransferase